jgi:DNA-binding NarL/FixJ family response regulator
MPDPKSILVVGQCSVDGPRIQTYLESLDPGIRVRRLQSDDEFEDQSVANADLILFNRELVGEFRSREGIQLIRALHDRYPDVKLMLVSDYDDAQNEACDAGALPGFGKRDLGTDRATRVVRDALS